VINGIAQQIYGAGLDANDKVSKVNQWAQMQTMLKPDALRKAILDLKIAGQCAFQVVYNRGKTKVQRIEHYPVETLRPELADEEGKIKAYYYTPDWKNLKPNDKPERLPSFGCGAKTDLNEILYVKPYSTGYFYFAPVDYQGCLPYCLVEQEVANYHINNIQNGFMASMLINFNNGQPDDKDQREIERRVEQKFTGTNNAGRFILAFNDNAESAATVDSVPITDAHSQYELVAKEAQEKIMVGHRVTSPMLLGIKDKTGLGNNAQELETAQELFDTTVLEPFRNLLIDSLKKVLSYNNITLKIFLRPLGQGEVKDIGELSKNDVAKSDISYNGAQISSAVEILSKVKEGVLNEAQAKVFLIQFLNLDPEDAELLFSQGDNLSVQHSVKKNLGAEDRPFLDDDTAYSIIENVEELGESEEDLLSDYDMIESEDAEGEPEDFYPEEYLKNTELAAQDESAQDGPRYKVRYAYVKGTRKQPKGESRPLCKRLISAGRVYRKEDILKMSSRGGAEDNKQTYSVWLYKGGANCYHRWERRVYRKRLTNDGEPWGGGPLQGTKKVSVNQAIRQGFKPPSNPKDVAEAPIDTPTKGYKS
jgi:hypothetical protein